RSDSSVLLPDPDGPTTATLSPRWIVTATSSRITSSPPGRATRLPRPRAASAGAAAGAAGSGKRGSAVGDPASGGRARISGRPRAQACHRLACRAASVPRRGREQRPGIDRAALPPLALGTELEDREVQVRRRRVGVPGAPHVTDHLAPPQRLAFRDPFRVAREVRVVVRVAA